MLFGTTGWYLLNDEEFLKVNIIAIIWIAFSHILQITTVAKLLEMQSVSPRILSHLLLPIYIRFVFMHIFTFSLCETMNE